MAALLEQIRGLTSEEARALRVVRDAARGAARDATQYTAWDAARDAVLAVLVRDLIAAEQYDLLTEPWRTVMGDPMGERIEQ